MIPIRDEARARPDSPTEAGVRCPIIAEEMSGKVTAADPTT